MTWSTRGDFSNAVSGSEIRHNKKYVHHPEHKDDASQLKEIKILGYHSGNLLVVVRCGNASEASKLISLLPKNNIEVSIPVGLYNIVWIDCINPSDKELFLEHLAILRDAYYVPKAIILDIKQSFALSKIHDDDEIYEEIKQSLKEIITGKEMSALGHLLEKVNNYQQQGYQKALLTLASVLYDFGQNELAKTVLKSVPDSLPSNILDEKYFLLAHLTLIEDRKNESSDEASSLDSDKPLVKYRAQGKEVYLCLTKIANPNEAHRSMMRRAADMYSGGNGISGFRFGEQDMRPSPETVLALVDQLEDRDEEIARLKQRIAQLEHQNNRDLGNIETEQKTIDCDDTNITTAADLTKLVHEKGKKGNSTPLSQGVISLQRNGVLSNTGQQHAVHERRDTSQADVHCLQDGDDQITEGNDAVQVKFKS